VNGWIITGIDDDGTPLFWNNEGGWGEGVLWATTFTEEERRLLTHFPVLLGRAQGGAPRWVPV
jgi:hypothetical protein